MTKNLGTNFQVRINGCAHGWTRVIMSVAENFHEYSARPENLDISNIPRSKDKLIVILKSLTDSLKNAQNR